LRPEASLEDYTLKTISWEKIKEETISDKITRKMFWGENVMVTRWRLAPNAIIPVHDHVSEQITMIETGSIVLAFPEEKVELSAGEMIVIPSSKPHGATVGPDGCIAMDIFSPIRRDFIEGTASYYGPSDSADSEAGEAKKDPYAQLYGFLSAKGISIPLEELKKVPLDLLARYTYEKECITMGELRAILGIDKTQAKALLREWKHGDDHSESSYKRSLERIVILISDLRPGDSKQP
jgi:quercetin dioxygenase-like cupin family protein